MSLFSQYSDNLHLFISIGIGNFKDMKHFPAFHLRIKYFTQIKVVINHFIPGKFGTQDKESSDKTNVPYIKML
jgi:hypothetical protein